MVRARSTASALAAFDAPYFRTQRWVVGVDEAGRGPLAGPVVAAACSLPPGVLFEGIDDSKKLSPKRREALLLCLQAHPEVFFGLGWVSSQEIDAINIYRASQLAMQLAVEELMKLLQEQRGAPPWPQVLLTDALPLPEISLKAPLCQIYPFVKGDSRSQSIAASSIAAKQARDAYMVEQDRLYPGYGFKEHKGYGTLTHRKALEELGPCPLHRRSFKGTEPAPACRGSEMKNSALHG